MPLLVWIIMALACVLEDMPRGISVNHGAARSRPVQGCTIDRTGSHPPVATGTAPGPAPGFDLCIECTGCMQHIHSIEFAGSAYSKLHTRSYYHTRYQCNTRHAVYSMPLK